MLRAFDRRTLIKLANAPVKRSVRELMESAIAMGRSALDSAGLSRREIERVEEPIGTTMQCGLRTRSRPATSMAAANGPSSRLRRIPPTRQIEAARAPSSASSSGRARRPAPCILCNNGDLRMRVYAAPLHAIHRGLRRLRRYTCRSPRKPSPACMCMKWKPLTFAVEEEGPDIQLGTALPDQKRWPSSASRNPICLPLSTRQVTPVCRVGDWHGG